MNSNIVHLDNMSTWHANLSTAASLRGDTDTALHELEIALRLWHKRKERKEVPNGPQSV